MNQPIEQSKFTTIVPDIVSEMFDGELVTANYGSGLYYSISREGCFIWQGLARGMTIPEITRWLSGHYAPQTDDLGPLVRNFVEKLVEEGLILTSTTDEPPASELPKLPDGVFSAPTIERFGDLQDLLLLDPVHDVDQAGWPRRPD